MEECNGEILTARSGRESVGTKLLHIAEKASNNPEVQFNNLYHLMNEEHLTQCFKALRGNAAIGVDKITKEMYAENQKENIVKLTEKLHKMSYRPITSQASMHSEARHQQTTTTWDTSFRR